MFKSFYCIMTVGCYKYAFKIYRLQFFKHIKAIKVRHFHIQKNKLGLQFIN